MIPNVLNIESTLWDLMQPALDEYMVVSIKIMLLNAQRKYDLADLYVPIRNKLELEIQEILEKK
jgi:hypothetical protein